MITRPIQEATDILGYVKKEGGELARRVRLSICHHVVLQKPNSKGCYPKFSRCPICVRKGSS